MKNALILIFIVMLFVSCNSDILVNNGNVLVPENSDNSNKPSEIEPSFSGRAPSFVNATKSYYKDSIVIRWNEVEGADYYTIEKASSDSETLPDSTIWKEIPETITSLAYTDVDNLEPSKYYFYRVKAHTVNGEKGEESKVVSGTILSSPNAIAATKGTSSSSIVITWEQMPYVESYNIYKSQNPIINGVASELLTTINSSDAKDNVYSYQITEKEAGVELYFAIEAVGPTLDKAEISLPRSGYTYVPGAPTQPVIRSITKGDSSSEIALSFKSEGDDVKYEIKKAAAGFSEMVIFSSENNTLPEPDENGFYTLTDNDVSSGVVYSYSIIAYNSLGKSKAALAEGYLLSPVEDVKLAPVNDGTRLGYKLSYKLPVGYDDPLRTIDYSYKFIKTFKNGTTAEDTISDEEISSIEMFFAVDENPTEEAEALEIRNVSITIVNEKGESCNPSISNSTLDIPAGIDSITATSNAKPLSTDSPNSEGVYPVHVEWVSSFDGPRVLTRTGSDGSIKKFDVTGNSFVDHTTSALVIYSYHIDTSDELGRTLSPIKHAENSYGSIAFETFAHMFESLSLKPFVMQEYVPNQYKSYWKQSKIATLVNYGNASDLSTQMKALDTAEDKDHFHANSKIYYNAKMNGIGGLIDFQYTNFGENANWACTGSYTMDVNASGTGSASSSTNGFTITGMYPGRVSLDKVSVKNKAFTGNYIITLNYSNGSASGEVAAR